MTLASEIQDWLDWGAEVGAPLGSLPLPERREALRDALDGELRRRGVTVEPVRRVHEHAVPVDGGEIRVRVFTPDADGPQAAFVHFHGGGFVLGTIDSLFNEAKCAHICNGAGCAVVTVEYRLAPEHRFPTAAEDCYTALLWTVASAPALGIDAERIAVGGESAGGNLAAAVALMARDRGGPRLALQLLEVPVVDLGDGANDHPSVTLFGEGYGLDRVDMDSNGESYHASPADGSNPYASPLLAPDLAGLPPAHVLTGEYDMLRDSGEAYARRLEEAGVGTTFHRLAGHTHGSSGLWQWWEPAHRWMAEVVGALERALHGVPAERR